ncbi:unnamed protein product [Rotaria sp. Silwood2]|nr:unnamed protein product [Rotaria sp. Silwood2]
MTSNISDFSSFFPSIKWIYVDGTNSNCCAIISEWIFHSKILRFVNLKKIILKQCYLTIKLIENLSFLIQYQLDVFIFTFDEDIFELIRYERRSRIIHHNEDSKFMFMSKKFLRELFSDKCQLTSLELNIPNDHNYNGIHECLSINNPVIIYCITLRHLHIHLIYGYFLENIITYVPALQTLSVTFKDSLMQKRLYEPKMKRFISINFNWYEKLTSLELNIPNDHNYNDIHECLSINNPVIIHCITLHHLHIHLIYGYFLEDIIKYVPALQTLSVIFKDSLMQKRLYELKMKRFLSIDSNWYENEKMPKLKSFSLKSIILNDCELNYFKWIINNVYHVEKLKIRLVIKNKTNENNIIDINYLRKNIIPAILINLVDFDFYIVSKCKLLFENNIEKIIDSFKNNRISIDRYWRNVQCYFDRIS